MPVKMYCNKEDIASLAVIIIIVLVLLVFQCVVFLIHISSLNHSNWSLL